MGAVTHEGLIDLAAARVGGRALVASDEFFASRHNLLAARPPVFIEGKYTDRGKWMGGGGARDRPGRGGARRRAARHERSILQRAAEPDHAGTITRHGRRLGDAAPPGPRP